MTEPSARRLRRPGDRVVRRRVEGQQVIPLPPPPRHREPPSLRGNAKRLAIAYAALVLIAAGLLSTPATTTHGDGTPFIDALFTAVSATSVTGLVTVDTPTHWNLFGEMLILLLIQAGGMGFMVGASVVLLTIRRTRSLRGSLIMRDGAPTISLQEARSLSRRILRFMLVAEAIGAVILAIEYFPESSGFWDAVWFGVFHSVSAFCNAGFDLQETRQSLYGFRDSFLIDLTVIALIQGGALSFVVFADLWDGRELLAPGRFQPRRFWQRLLLDTKLILTTNLVLIVLGAAAFAAVEWQTTLAHIPGPADKAMAAVFQSVSARTAGFATIDYSQAHHATLFIWIGLMMIGGASASTAGGVKLATFAVVVLAIVSTLRGQSEPQVAGKRIPTPIVFRAITIIALFIIAHFALTLALVLTEDAIGRNDFAFLPLMFETMSALATVGVSTGITDQLTTAGKVVLCLTMFVGRLGPLTAVYALQRREVRQSYSFPEAYVRMG
jgi:trk system potassium uptake protein TrkH